MMITSHPDEASQVERRALIDALRSSGGGRVLSVVASGHPFAEARARVYLALDAIHLEGGHCRRDIGLRVSE